VDFDDGEGNQLRAANLMVAEEDRIPRPVVPPRGLSGVLDGYDATEILDTSQFPPNMVLLNVYDLSRDVELFQKINKVTTGNNNALIGGLFHAGVEAYGIEWCFGFTDDGRTGVCPLEPRSHPQHKYRTTVPMGVTSLSDEDVKALLVRMSEEWPGYEYDLFHNNCLNFSNALCSELGVGRIPGWVDRAARAAAALDTGYRGAAHGVQKFRSALPADAVEAQIKAGEALEVVQRRSVSAIGVVQTQAQELHGRAMPFVRAKTADLGEKANELLGEDNISKAQEHVAVIGEKAQAIGASFWSGIRDLHRAASETIEEASKDRVFFGRDADPSQENAPGSRERCDVPPDRHPSDRSPSAARVQSSSAATSEIVPSDAAPAAPRSSALGSPGGDLLVSPVAKADVTVEAAEEQE